jgi:hypothetical protein
MTAFDPKIYRNSKDGIGGPGDDAATNSTSAWTTVALLKGLYQLLGVSGIAVSGGTMATAAKQDTGNTTLTAIDGHVDGLETLVTSSNTKLDTLHADIATTQAGLVGGLTETAPATDTASSGLNGRLQRIAQRLTSLIALVPASLGAKTAAASFSVTTATDDALIAPIGIVTETAPATDTASSGLNGRLQRIAQRITSLIALFYAQASSTSGQVGPLVQGAVVNTAPGYTNNFTSPLSLDTAGNLRVVEAASALQGGIPSTGRLLSAAGSSGDATSVKASAGRLYAIQGYNAAAAVRYLKLYNSASAPTAGSGTPVKTLALPPGVGFAFDWPLGYYFSSGIGFTLVTGSADNSAASVTAADILGLNLDYA